MPIALQHILATLGGFATAIYILGALGAILLAADQVIIRIFLALTAFALLLICFLPIESMAFYGLMFGLAITSLILLTQGRGGFRKVTGAAGLVVILTSVPLALDYHAPPNIHYHSPAELSHQSIPDSHLP